MPRNAIIALSAVIYVALSVWLVGKQGQAYRDGLRRDQSTVEQSEKSAQAEPDANNNVPPAGITKNTAVKPQAAPAVATVSRPANDKLSDRAIAPPHLEDKPKANHALPKDTDQPRGQRRAKESTSPDPLANDPFWNQPQMTRNWDLANQNTADELRLGAELHDVIVQLNPVCDDGPWLSRVEEAAKPLLKSLNRREIPYRFTILDSDEVNAFSHPGGYVYVSRGLFDLIGEDEDYALQFAVGCEIAHVDLQHAIRCLDDPDVKKMNGGTLRKLYWLIIPFGYLVSDKINQDYQADEWVLSRMRSLGRTNRETLAFLRKLDGYAEKHGFKNGHAKVRLGPETSLLDIHYRRQTAAWRRLDHLKERVD
jgi:Peptidase family M48